MGSFLTSDDDDDVKNTTIMSNTPPYCEGNTSLPRGSYNSLYPMSLSDAIMDHSNKFNINSNTPPVCESSYEASVAAAAVSAAAAPPPVEDFRLHHEFATQDAVTNDQFAPPTPLTDASDKPTKQSSSDYCNTHVYGTPLAAAFEHASGEYDVVCGRGKGSYNRPGNRRLRDIILQHMDEYTSAKTKMEKTVVLNSVIVQVETSGRFIKRSKDKTMWLELTPDQAREKVGHAMREAISSTTRSKQVQKNRQVREQVFLHKQSEMLAQQQDLFSRFVNSNQHHAGGYGNF